MVSAPNDLVQESKNTISQALTQLSSEQYIDTESTLTALFLKLNSYPVAISSYQTHSPREEQSPVNIEVNIKTESPCSYSYRWRWSTVSGPYQEKYCTVHDSH